MPTESHIEETPKDDGTVSEKLVVEFSNGSLQQLRDLGAFLKIQSEDPYEVIKYAIGILENVKESNEKKHTVEG